MFLALDVDVFVSVNLNAIYVNQAFPMEPIPDSNPVKDATNHPNIRSKRRASIVVSAEAV